MISPHNFTIEQKLENIEKHLDSEKHSQKEQVLESYTVYARLRGFDMESEIHLPNLRFFLTALRAKTLGGKGAAKNCLSVIVNILDLTTSQYNDLQADVDPPVGVFLKTPNYLCFSCNFHTFGGIPELKKHIEAEQHATNGDHFTNVVEKRTNLYCSKCDVFFNINNIDDHAGHELSAENIDSILQRSESKQMTHPVMMNRVQIKNITKI